MLSKVEVWNVALGHLRASTVGSEYERTAEAELCRRYYALSKGSLLTEAPWSFATSPVVLARRSTSPNGRGFAFALPKGHLRVWNAWSSGSPCGHRQGLDFDLQLNIDENEVDLVTDVPEVTASITMDVDERLLPPSAVIALGHILAANLAVPLAGAGVGTKFQKEQMDWYERAIAALHTIDSSDRRERPEESRYLLARR